MDWYKLKLNDEKESRSDICIELLRTPDTFDVIKCNDMCFNWGYEEGKEESPGVDYIRQNVLVDLDLGDMEFEMVNSFCILFRNNPESIYKIKWCFGDEVELWTNTMLKTRMTVEGVGEVIDYERLSFGESIVPFYGHVGPNMDKLNEQLKNVRGSNNSHNQFDHRLLIEGEVDMKLKRKSYYVANTSEWKFHTALRFLGRVREHNSSAIEGYHTEHVSVGKEIPPWITINGRSGVGVVDLLPKYTVVDFPSIGAAEYVKLDHRYPNFVYHISSMCANPAVSVIVLLHHVMEFPEGCDARNSTVHEKQFKNLYNAVKSDSFRKPILVMVRPPGVAKLLQKGGCHVSPSVEDCMDDLRQVIKIFMCTGLIQYKKAEIEELS